MLVHCHGLQGLLNRTEPLLMLLFTPVLFLWQQISAVKKASYQQPWVTHTARCYARKCGVTLHERHTGSLIPFPEQWQISLWHNPHLWRHNFIYRHRDKRQAAWRHCPPLHCHRWELLAYLPCTRAYQASLRGDSVTPTNTASPKPCSRLLLSSPHRASPSRAEPGVLSVPDSYRLTLKHKRGERRNRQIDRQKEDGNTNRVGGDGYWLSSSVIMLSISIFKSLLLLLSLFKIHQRKRNKRDRGIYWDFKKGRKNVVVVPTQ